MSRQQQNLRRRSSDSNRRKLSEAERGVSTPPGPSLLDLKTIYEGPAGRHTSRLLHKTSLVITNRTVEIEREGANLPLTMLTCGCWYLCFQTASIEIYELQRIQTLYLKDDVIIGEIQPRERCGRGKFEIDTPRDGDKSTKDLFFELKEAWNIARHSILHGDGMGAVDEDDQLLVGQ